jgi:5-methylcytosine-specific restriction endonuclease McrA
VNWGHVRNTWLKVARDTNGPLRCEQDGCDYVSDHPNKAGLLICALCHGVIDTNLYKHPDPRSMEVDHRIPRAHGGKDRIDNTQPTHRACNSSKNDDQHALGVLKTSRDWSRPST